MSDPTDAPATDTAGEDPSRTLQRVPGDGPDSPPTSAVEAPPPRRARRVTPDPGISATAVADPLLAADAAAAEASNGDHADGDHADEVTAPAAVIAATATEPKQPKSTRSSNKRKTAAAAKATTVGAAAAAVDVVELPPTEQIDAVKADAVKADGVKVDAETADAAKIDAKTEAKTEAKTDSVVSDGQPTPSSGVPMVALIPPAGAVDTVAAPTAPTPTVTAPTAATVVAATAVAPVVAPVVAPAPQAKKQPKAAVAPRRRVRARRVQRIVRRVDAWSVMKISFIFFIVMYLVLLVAGVLLWAFAVGTGTIDNVENFIEQLFALDSFSFVGAQILRASIIGGALLVVAGTFTTTVLAVLFNLISDLVGGVRFTVVEEQVLRPVSPSRPAPGAAAPSSVDDAPSRPGTV